MTRIATLVAFCLVVLTPALSPAAIEIRFGEPEMMGGRPGTYGVDVYAVGTDDEDEQLFAYDIAFILQRDFPVTSPAFFFAAPYAEKPADGFVFGGRPVNFAVADNPAPDPARFLLGVEAQTSGGLPDVTGPTKIARVLVEHSGAIPTGFHYLRVDPELTVFGSGDPTRVDDRIEVEATDEVVFFPEPSAAGLILAGAALTLCRRRRR